MAPFPPPGSSVTLRSGAVLAVPETQLLCLSKELPGQMASTRRPSAARRPSADNEAGTVRRDTGTKSFQLCRQLVAL